MENLTEYKIKTRRNDHFQLAEKWENCLPKRREITLPNKWEKSLTFTQGRIESVGYVPEAVQVAQRARNYVDISLWEKKNHEKYSAEDSAAIKTS